MNPITIRPLGLNDVAPMRDMLCMFGKAFDDIALSFRFFRAKPMHIDSTTHEHGASGHVYDYEGDFEVDDDRITWQAGVRRAGEDSRIFSGTIKLTSPAIASLAEQAVRDAILKRIDTFDDRQGNTAAYDALKNSSA